MPSRKERGYATERKLVLYLWKKGYKVFRIPMSGSRSSKLTKSALPDIFAINKRTNTIIAFEVKGTSKDYVVVPKYQVKKLFDFVNAFPSSILKKCIVAVYFHKYKHWVFHEVKEPEAIRIHYKDSSNIEI